MKTRSYSSYSAGYLIWLMKGKIFFLRFWLPRQQKGHRSFVREGAANCDLPGFIDYDRVGDRHRTASAGRRRANGLR